MQLLRIGAAISAAALTVAGLAPVASADQVWNQSVGRVSVSAACPTSPANEQATGWSQWAPSWEQWANNGKGGFVCSRAITWAKDTARFPSGGCLSNGSYYFQFGGSYFLPLASTSYGDSSCSTPSGFPSTPVVYAPAPYVASTLCLAAYGTQRVSGGPYGDHIYSCGGAG